MIPLNTIQVPKPCGENWDAMDGDAQKRFCAGCGCHVHDLSAMTSIQAQALLDQKEGRVCVRFQTRPDGTVLTQDALPDTARPAFWPRRLAAAASWVLALTLTGLGLTARAETVPHRTSHAKAKPHAAPTAPRPPRTMGMIALPRPMPSHPAPRKPELPTTMGDVAMPPVKATLAPTVQHPAVMGKMAVVPSPQKK